MRRTFTFQVEVIDHVCDDSPGFPAHAYAHEKLCDWLRDAWTHNHLQMMDRMMTPSENKAVNDAAIKSYRENRDQIEQVIKSIRVVKASAPKKN